MNFIFFSDSLFHRVGTKGKWESVCTVLGYWLRLNHDIHSFSSNIAVSAKGIGLQLVHQGNVYEHKEPHCLCSAVQPRHQQHL